MSRFRVVDLTITWLLDEAMQSILTIAILLLSSAASAAEDPGRLVQLKSQPPELNSLFNSLVIPFSVTNISLTFLKFVWVECAALDNETLVDLSAAPVQNIKQNETAYGYVLFTKTKDLKLHFKCRISDAHN
jgi:hypothetical protein